MQLYNLKEFRNIVVMDIPGIDPEVGCFTVSFKQGDTPEEIKPVAEIAVKIDENTIITYNSYFGPICKYVKANKDTENRKKFYYFDEIDEDETTFSQLLVEELGLPQKIIDGKFKQIVETLQTLRGNNGF